MCKNRLFTQNSRAENGGGNGGGQIEARNMLTGQTEGCVALREKRFGDTSWIVQRKVFTDREVLGADPQKGDDVLQYF